MNRTNVTVSLPDHLVREARHLAVDEGVSLSRFLAQVLEERISTERRYREARERQQRFMEEGLDLGTSERIAGSSEELHEHRLSAAKSLDRLRRQIGPIGVPVRDLIEEGRRR